MYTDLSLTDLQQMNADYPSRLIVLLYDEVIASLRATNDAIERGDIEARCMAANRAVEIVSHLYEGLDMQQGGAIAESLAGIYHLIIVEMPQVHIHNDAALVERMIALLTPLREAWAELDDRIRGSIAFAEAFDGDGLAATVVAANQLGTGATA